MRVKELDWNAFFIMAFVHTSECELSGGHGPQTRAVVSYVTGFND